MRGTLCSSTCSSVSRLQASSGSAAFLLPAGTIVPDSGTPPSIRSFSMSVEGLGPRGWARVTAMSEPLSREQAWDLFCSWTESESLRRHVLAVEAAMRAYARSFGEDEETWGLVGMLHDLDYERHPDLETGHPARGAAGARGAGLLARVRARGRLARRLPRGLARLGDGEDAVRGRRAVRLHHGLRVRAAGGHPRDDPEIGQEEDEDARLRRRGRPRGDARGRRASWAWTSTSTWRS